MVLKQCKNILAGRYRWGGMEHSILCSGKTDETVAYLNLYIDGHPIWKLILKNNGGWGDGGLHHKEFHRGCPQASTHLCVPLFGKRRMVLQSTSKQNDRRQKTKKDWHLVLGVVMGTRVDLTCAFFSIAYNFSLSRHPRPLPPPHFWNKKTVQKLSA